MPTFAESIAESFHSEVDVNWSLRSTTQPVARFTVKTVTVEVGFEQREHRGPWHVAFNTLRADMADRANVTLAFRIFNACFRLSRNSRTLANRRSCCLSPRTRIWCRFYQTYLRREAADLEKLGYRLEGPHKVEPYTAWTLRRIKSPWREMGGRNGVEEWADTRSPLSGWERRFATVFPGALRFS